MNRHNCRPREVRSKVENASRFGKRRLHLIKSELSDIEHARPRTRADCVNGIRPCPFVGCEHHLYLDITAAGNIKLNFPDIEPDQLEHSCSLDIADAGEHTLEQIGALINTTRERVRQLEGLILRKLARRAAAIWRELGSP